MILRRTKSAIISWAGIFFLQIDTDMSSHVTFSSEDSCLYSGGARWPVVKILFAICIRRLGLYFVSKIDSENRATSGDFRPFKFTFKTVVWDDGEYWEKSDLSWISNLLRMPVKLDPPQDAPCNPDHWAKLTQHSERVVTLFCGILFGSHFRFWNKFDIMSRRCHSIWQPNESFPVDLVSEKF